MIQFLVKSFSELTSVELYDILQLRNEVFVVEQNCVYLDTDGKDAKALHIVGYKNDILIAYTRIFKPGDYVDKASIGRVVVKATERTHGYGKVLMNASIEAVEKYFSTGVIQISAQTYLLNFYKELGFIPQGEGYLEDGIPHMRMIRTNTL